jgi:hypothetical protein
VENADIQIVSHEAGEPTAVIVPVEHWREIRIGAGHRLPAQVRDDEMKQSLPAARQRQEGLSLDTVIEKLRI